MAPRMTLDEYNRRRRELQNAAAPYDKLVELDGEYLRGLGPTFWGIYATAEAQPQQVQPQTKAEV